VSEALLFQGPTGPGRSFAPDKHPKGLAFDTSLAFATQKFPPSGLERSSDLSPSVLRKGLPVIGESTAHLTIRLAFADGWSDLASLRKAWLANPYRSSSGYRLALQGPTGPGRSFAPDKNFCVAKVASAATGDQSLESYHRRDIVVEAAGNPRLEHTSNIDYFEDSFFSLRSGFLQSKTKPGLVRVGESVEDWLEYWFDGWFQNCYGVKRCALAPATGFAFVGALGPFEPELLLRKSCRNVVPAISQLQTLLLCGAKSGFAEQSLCSPFGRARPTGLRALRALEPARQRKAKSRPPALALLAMSARAAGLTKPKALKGLSLQYLRDFARSAKQIGFATQNFGFAKQTQDRTFDTLEQKWPERASGLSKAEVFRRNILALRALERPTVSSGLSSPSQVGEHIWFVRKRSNNLECSYLPAAGAATGGQSRSVATKAERSALAFLFSRRGRVNLRKPKKSDNLQQKRRFCLENGFSFSVFIFLQKVARYEDRVLQLFNKTTPDSSQLNLVGPLNITLVRASLALKHSLARFAQREPNDRVARATDFNRVRSRTINKSASAPRSAKLNENQIQTKRATGVGPKHNLASYLAKHEQRVKWVKREVFSSPYGANRPPVGKALRAQVGGNLGPLRGKLLAPQRGANRNVVPAKARRALGILTRVSDTRIGRLGAGAPCSADRENGTSITGTTFRQLLRSKSSAPSGPQSVRNLDSHVWFPEIITTFKIMRRVPDLLVAKRGALAQPQKKPSWRSAEQPEAGPTFRLAALSRSEIVGTKFRPGPVGPLEKGPTGPNPNNKNLIFSDAHNDKDFITDATFFSESEAPTSKSIKDDISVGGTSPERSDVLPCSKARYTGPSFAFRKRKASKTFSFRGEGGARRSLKTEVERAERVFSFAEQALGPLTNPRFLLAGLAWARRALEKYRDAGLQASLTRRRQLNRRASALKPRSAVVPAIELANQAQEGRTKPDVFFGNEDVGSEAPTWALRALEYGYEEGPVSAIDDEPEINRVGDLNVGFTEGEPFRTDSDSAKWSKAQPRRVEHNETALEAGKAGTDSYMKVQMDLQAIQEVLSYTGGGALRELLRCFDTQAFSAILLNEIKLLREYHKGYFLYEYDQVSGKAMFGSTEGPPEPRPRPVGWPEGPRTLFDRSLLSEPDQLLPSRHSFVKPAWLSGAKLRPGPFGPWSKAKQIEIDNQAEYDNNYEELPEEINRFSRAIHRNARRLKIVQLLMRNKRRPEWMLISALPVLPPDLRPILQMSENLIVASDLNTLYQRVIYRNNRQYKLRIVEWSYATSLQRLVQDAVDRLIENGKGGSKPFLTPGGRPLKSLSDTLKGKKGRFRLNLLGKRVDFSGRSVIVVSPHLKIHECGLPREMALELYQYLLIRQMLLKRQVSSVILAKRVIREQKDFVWDTLRELIYHHPLLLNRAPTLHRLGIQAFQPKLVLGSTILLHPLVCAGFNADFDGDQMGVHLPLCDEARAEAWDLLWSRNNLLSPATGEPILLPSQDMVLGFYHMTALLPFRYAHSTAPFTNRRFVQAGSDRSIAQGADKACRRGGFGFVQIDARLPQIQKSVLFEKGFRKSHFYSPLDVVRAYQNGDLDIHTPIWLQWNGKIENNDSGQIPLEVRINSFGVSTQLYPSYKYRKDATSKLTATFNLFIRTTPGRVIVNNIF
jgi:DNA-directed RNA polymerase subunit beta'